MAEKQDMGQEASRLLRVVAALVGGEPLRIAGESLPVEVVSIMRDNWPNALVYVQLATERGRETVLLDDIEFVSTERVEVGADGCGCPVTEEITANDASVEGTERTEHRAGCWNAPAVDES